MTKSQIRKQQQALTKWQDAHADTKSLRKAYQEKVLDWEVKSMEFEKEPVSMGRLKELMNNKEMGGVIHENH